MNDLLAGHHIKHADCQICGGSNTECPTTLWYRCTAPTQLAASTALYCCTACSYFDDEGNYVERKDKSEDVKDAWMASDESKVGLWKTHLLLVCPG